MQWGDCFNATIFSKDIICAGEDIVSTNFGIQCSSLDELRWLQLRPKNRCKPNVASAEYAANVAIVVNSCYKLGTIVGFANSLL